MPPSSPPTTYLGTLDWLRGLAALAVAIFHYTHNGLLPADHAVAQIAYYGHLGVKPFFVISGLVIPFAMWWGKYRWASAGQFFAKRFIRIYPPYVVCLLAVALVVWLRVREGFPSPVTLADVGWHLLYLNDALGRPWLMEIFWTLALEIQFYLMMALIFPLLRGPVWITWAVLGAWWGFGWLMARGFPVSDVRHIFTYGPYFFLGIALFRFHVRLDGPVLLAVHALACFWLIRGAAGDMMSLWACAPVLITVFLPNLRYGAGRFLGNISYSFYLWHMPTWEICRVVYPISSSEPLPWLIFIPVVLGVSFLVAWAGYHWIERPAMAWSKRISYR